MVYLQTSILRES